MSRYREIAQEKVRMGLGYRIGGMPIGGKCDCCKKCEKCGGAPSGYKACKDSVYDQEIKSGKNKGKMRKAYKHYAKDEAGCEKLKNKGLTKKGVPRKVKESKYGPGPRGKMYTSPWQLFVADAYAAQDKYKYKDFLKHVVSDSKFKDSYVGWLYELYPDEWAVHDARLRKRGE